MGTASVTHHVAIQTAIAAVFQATGLRVPNGPAASMIPASRGPMISAMVRDERASVVELGKLAE